MKKIYSKIIVILIFVFIVKECNFEQKINNIAFTSIAESELRIANEEEIIVSQEDWKEAYIHTLKGDEEELINRCNEANYYEPEVDYVSGYLYDMNNDGVPELFYYVCQEAAFERKQYTYIDGNLVEINYTPKEYIKNEHLIGNCIVTDSYLGQDIGCDVEFQVLKMEGNTFIAESYLIQGNLFETAIGDEPKVTVNKNGSTFQIEFEEFKSALKKANIIVEKYDNYNSEYDYTEIKYSFNYDENLFKKPNWQEVDDLINYINNYSQESSDSISLNIDINDENNINQIETQNQDTTENINEIIDDSVTADITLRDGNVIIDLNKDMFESDNTVYNYDIAKLAVTLSEAAYDDKNETKNGKYIVNTYKSLGFEDENISLYSYPNSPYNVSGKIFEDNTLAFSIANRKLGDKTLLVIDFRGTKPLGDIIKDFSGGLHFKASRGIYTKDKQFMDTLAWGGFYDFWEDYNIAIDDYYQNHQELQKADEEGNLIVLVTGHSLGAAAANLTGKSLNEGASEFCNLSKDNIYVYTFACPLACLKTTADDNIFNIVNMDDVIPFVPPGYKRYGAKAEVFETGNKFFDGYSLTDNHSCGTYLNAVFNNKVSENIEPIKKKFRLGAIFCPVDVEIKKDGVVVGKVVNNEVTVCDDDINLEIEEDHKFFVLPDDDLYTIDINATGDGSMSFYILGSDGENSFMNTYSDISIKGGENFTAEISSFENMNDVSLKYEGEKKTITIPEDTDEQTSGEQFIEIKNKSEKTSVIYWIIGISASFIVLLIIVFMLVGKSRKTKKAEISKDNNFSIQDNNDINNNKENVFCTECGKLLSSKQRFCPVCGSKNKLYNGNDK